MIGTLMKTRAQAADERQRKAERDAGDDDEQRDLDRHHHAFEDVRQVADDEFGLEERVEEEGAAVHVSSL